MQIIVLQSSRSMKKYKKDLPEYVEWFPDKFYFEELRIKKYEPGTIDQFGLHTDVQDHQSAKRYLLFSTILMMILKEERRTFPYNELTVKPRNW